MNEYDLDETNQEHIIWMLKEILRILKNSNITPNIEKEGS